MIYSRVGGKGAGKKYSGCFASSIKSDLLRDQCCLVCILEIDIVSELSGSSRNILCPDRAVVQTVINES
mgnify:CR=1 FL=1